MAEAEALCRAGQLPVAVDVDDTTLLHTVAEFGMLEHVKVLISHGADVNRYDARGLTPLHLAVQFGHEEVVEELVACGADVEAPVRKPASTATDARAVLSRLFGLSFAQPVRPVDLAKQAAIDRERAHHAGTDTGSDADTTARDTARRIHDKLDLISCSSGHPSLIPSSSSSRPSSSSSAAMCDLCEASSSSCSIS